VFLIDNHQLRITDNLQQTLHSLLINKVIEFQCLDDI